MSIKFSHLTSAGVKSLTKPSLVKRYRFIYKILLSFLTTFSFTLQVQATTVMGIISPRHSTDVLSGAHEFLLKHPQHKIILRTTDQFGDLDDEERHQLLQQTNLIFTGGVFGDVVPWLTKYAEENAKSVRLVAVHGDRNLVEASHLKGKSLLRSANLDQLMIDPPLDPALDLQAWFKNHLETHKAHSDWLLAKTFWADRNSENIDGLFHHLFRLSGEPLEVPTPALNASLRIFVNGELTKIKNIDLNSAKKWVAILDYETADRPGEVDLQDQLCASFKEKNYGCLRLLAKWGESSVKAVEVLSQHKKSIGIVISLQNFVIGGGEGRVSVNNTLKELNIPVIKGIRLTKNSREEWLLSEEGLAASSVHYRVAMPELQGVIEPIVVAAMTAASIDKQTGLKLSLSKPIAAQVNLLERRVIRWLALQDKKEKEKKLAIIYYNHPPGRHNIGADNLNVPASLFHILQQLKQAGYETGELPETEEDLLDLLQAKGVNLPEDRQALTAMSKQVATVSTTQYQQWFSELPSALQLEMVEGPLGYLHAMLQRAINLEDRSIGRRLLARVLEDLHHAIDGADHPARERVADLLNQLEDSYKNSFDGTVDWNKAEELVAAIADSGIEGIRGWGEVPGKIMVHDDKILIPGVEFGNIFIGPQPPRGWELNEELLHANLSFPPPHQYLAFYQWIRRDFQADAVIHLGRHSTYEFLPRRRVGMSNEDYSIALLDDLPSVYPYIVDGVGEGIQAKRRGLAVMIDHLTPPLDSTDLYDELLKLRQLVESYEAAPSGAAAVRERALSTMKKLIDELNLRDELIASMAGELEVRGFDLNKPVDFDQIDAELLVHEVGHYLTNLQEDFMPLGLHVFGRDWSEEAISTMLTSMAKDDELNPEWRTLLSLSPPAEMSGLLTGLSGQYITPGKGNDPIRTPESLPTGRNFFALDGSLIPSRLGYDIGVELAQKARGNTKPNETDAIVLWASDVVRDEGAMIAFGFDMLGVKPIWSSRGIVKGLERLDLTSLQKLDPSRMRRDAVFTTSGLFRDLYGSHMLLLERAVLMALDASSETIHRDYPALSYALNAALKPLGSDKNPGSESLAHNLVAARWVEDAREALKQGLGAEIAGKQSAYRVFGDAPGTYGAGVNRMVERSGSWGNRSEIADVYLRRMGHAYGLNLHGEPALDTFKQRLKTVNNTYLGRASNLYGLLDNNDTFDYLGGLSLAVETFKGEVPENFVIDHSDSKNLKINPLQVALLTELRGRFLNPQWLEPLMDEGYAGARTMGSEFLEYLWGWQVTNPDVIKSWVWDEVKAVYIDDKLNINLDEFLEEGHNVHVKSNMLAVMLVAAQKEFWETDDATLKQLADDFTRLILKHGLPGSGHTSPDHPLYSWLENYVAEAQYEQLQKLLQATKVDASVKFSPAVIAEITMQDVQQPQDKNQPQVQPETTEESAEPNPKLMYSLIFILLMLLGAGAYRGMRSPEKNQY